MRVNQSNQENHEVFTHRELFAIAPEGIYKLVDNFFSENLYVIVLVDNTNEKSVFFYDEGSDELNPLFDINDYTWDYNHSIFRKIEGDILFKVKEL